MRYVIAISLSVVLSGCVTIKTAEERQQEQMEYLLRTSETAIKEKDSERLGNAMLPILDRSGTLRAAELLRKYPHGAGLYREYFERNIAQLSVPDQAANLRRHLDTVRPTKLLDETTVSVLSARLTSAVIEGNNTGSVPFRLAHLDTFPELGSNKQALADRTVSAISEVGRRAESYEHLARYLRSVGAATAEGARIQEKILTSGIKRSDVAHFQQIPELSKVLQERLYSTAQFRFKGGDRLAAEDMKDALKAKFKGLIWSENPSDEQIVVTVERIRYDEQRGSERRETVTYAQHQVNLLSAALLMPRNASYAYEVISMDSSIDFGYVVTVEGRGAKFEEVARGKLDSREVRCSNARVQNVFGGVTAADFVANDHMASTCRSGNNKTLESLRREVYEKVVETAARSTQLKALADD